MLLDRHSETTGPRESQTSPGKAGSRAGRQLRTFVTRVLARLYQEQLAMVIPAHPAPTVHRIPAGYSIRGIESQADTTRWAHLLNAESGFGRWDEARINDEIIGDLISPESVLLLFSQEVLIGCAAICKGDRHRSGTSTGMYFVIDPKHRGQFQISAAMVQRAVILTGQAGYSGMFISTFPDRLSALALYLSLDARPIRSSLWSHVQWASVLRRVRPVTERLRQRQAAKIRREAETSQALPKALPTADL